MSEWIVDRLPTAEDYDPDGDVLIPHAHARGIEYGKWTNIRLGDPWLPLPPLYVPPKTRDELVQELLDAIDKHGACGAIQEKREKLK